MRLIRHLQRQSPTYLGVVAGGSGLASAAFERTEWPFWVLITASVGALAGQAVVSHRAISSAREVQEEFKIAVWDQLAPLSRQLGKMAVGNRDKCKAMLDETLQIAVVCASGLAGDHVRTRATYFGRKQQNGHPTMVPKQSAGRGDAPQSVFSKGVGSAEGDAVWEYAEKDLERYVVDVVKTPPPGWDPDRKRAYRTFITVPVWYGDAVTGLLTVNAVDPGSLSENDVKTMRIIASLIGTAIGMTRRAP